MQEIRCLKCNKLLCKINRGGIGLIFEDAIQAKKTEYQTMSPGNDVVIELKCPRCGQLGALEGKKI